MIAGGRVVHLMAVGDETHELPVTAALRVATAKEAGDEVTVHLRGRTR